jgi:hypothetical protein
MGESVRLVHEVEIPRKGERKLLGCLTVREKLRKVRTMEKLFQKDW